MCSRCNEKHQVDCLYANITENLHYMNPSSSLKNCTFLKLLLEGPADAKFKV